MESIRFGYVRRVIGVSCLDIIIVCDDGSEFNRQILVRGFNPVLLRSWEANLAFRAMLLFCPAQARIGCKLDVQSDRDFVDANVYLLDELYVPFAKHPLDDKVNGIDLADVLSYLRLKGFPKETAFQIVGRPLQEWPNQQLLKTSSEPTTKP